MIRVFSLAVLALVPFVGWPNLTAQDLIQDGKVGSISDTQLMMVGKDGKETAFTLAQNVKVMRDGRTCTADELKPRMKVRITTRTEDKQMVIRIEALESQGAFDGTHDGRLVSITENKVVMTGKNGKEHSHPLASYAKLSCDGQPCKWDEIKPGTKIRVTTKSENTQWVVRIEAIDKQELFNGTQDGKFVSNTESKLLLTDKDGKEQTLNLSVNTVVTCDGRTCKVDDLKAGMRIRITALTGDIKSAIHIEALDKQEAFAVLN